MSRRQNMLKSTVCPFSTCHCPHDFTYAPTYESQDEEPGHGHPATTQIERRRLSSSPTQHHGANIVWAIYLPNVNKSKEGYVRNVRGSQGEA